MQFDDAAAGRESDPGSWILADRMQPLKEIEDARLVFRRDADAVIAHREAPLALVLGRPDPHDGPATWDGELQGVADEILKQLEEQGGLAEHFRQLRWDLDGRVGCGDLAGEVTSRHARRFSQIASSGVLVVTADSRIGQQRFEHAAHALGSVDGDPEMLEGLLTELRETALLNEPEMP